MKLSARSKNKLLGVGLASGLVGAQLGGFPTANATCLGIAGISINDGSGGHCSSSLFGFALGLGPGTSATADGFFNAAIAVGTNTTAIAGTGGLDFLNLAFNSGQATQGATSTVTAGGGGFNLAANLGGNANTGGGSGFSNLDVSATNGFGNVALNAIGSNRNTIRAGDGFLNFAVNVGGRGGRGSDSRVSATNNLSVAFQSQTVLGGTCVNANNPGCGNVVTAIGPLSLVVAAGVVGKEVVQDGPGITLANSFNADTFPPQPLPATSLAASGTQANGVRLNPTASNNNGLAASGTQANGVRLNPTASNNNGLAASGTQRNRVRLNPTASNNNGLAASGTQRNRVRLNPTGINTTGISTVGPTGTNTVGGTNTTGTGSTGTNTTGTNTTGTGK